MLKLEGSQCPPEPPLNCLWLAVSNWWGAKIIDDLVVDEPKTSQFIVQWIFLSLLSCLHYFFSDQRRRYSDRLTDCEREWATGIWYANFLWERDSVYHMIAAVPSHPEPTQPTALPPGPPQSTATPPGLQPLIPQPACRTTVGTPPKTSTCCTAQPPGPLIQPPGPQPLIQLYQVHWGPQSLMQHPILPPGTQPVIQSPEHQPEIQPSGSTIPAPEVQPSTIPQT